MHARHHSKDILFVDGETGEPLVGMARQGKSILSLLRGEVGLEIGGKRVAVLDPTGAV